MSVSPLEFGMKDFSLDEGTERKICVMDFV